MEDCLSGLKEELQTGVTSCVSGYLGFITHPQRERLTKDICTRIETVLKETEYLSVNRKWEWRYEEQLSLIRTLEDNAVKLRKEIRTLKKGVKNG